MPAEHVIFLVEEPSMEAFLKAWLPRYLSATFDVVAFQGKDDLLGKLEARLRGYAAWIPADWRLVVIVDRDDDDCLVLKARLEDICTKAGVTTRRSAPMGWVGATCLAIEELEAWYFGNWPAVRAAFPKVSPNVPRIDAYRNSDGILGGTWEAFERIMQKAGYFNGGLQKVRAARDIGSRIDSDTKSTSSSFTYLARVLNEIMA